MIRFLTHALEKKLIDLELIIELVEFKLNLLN